MWNYSAKPDIWSYRWDGKVNSQLENCKFLQMLSKFWITMRNLTAATIESSIPNQEIFMLGGSVGGLPQYQFTVRLFIASIDFLLLSLINLLTKDSTCPPCDKNKCIKLNRLKFERVLTLVSLQTWHCYCFIYDFLS